MAPLPRLVALLLTGACRAGRNTCYLDRRRAAPVFTGLCQDGGMDDEDLRLAAAHWYDGRLDRGYVRREPSQAAAYLRGVGLSGSFWGL